MHAFFLFLPVSCINGDYMDLWYYFINNLDNVIRLTAEHIVLVGVSVGFAVLIGVGLGVLISYYQVLARGVLYICQVIMTIPSLAVFGLLIPLFGIGFKTGVIALVLYSLLPIVRNTYTGIEEIDPAVIQAAQGMGMNETNILRKIKLPLAWPIIMAGIRTSVVMIIGIGAIASFVGAGGLGEFIFRGISQWNMNSVLVGAIFVSIVAIVADRLLKWAEHRTRV
ncbi:ABC transporter [Candidatus Syntrophocurvum alkaliphilum]|uniref:ABC transporter n=2 Tax=Candidatus Syntrophocurvum alkaliphilum TaxID=2293317 RepID=A0A6I6DFV7_9FIRM|nr:ABC transporter [Candidatus Syntrophocurvum alkaliphilum]